MGKEIATLSARTREEFGSAASRRLRRAGELPGLLSGLGKEPLAIAVAEHEFDLAHAGGVRIVSLDLGDRQVEAFIRDIQWDPFGHRVLHVDFDRVDRAQTIDLQVPVVTFGEAAGVAAGGSLDVYVDTLTVTCLPTAIPEHIEVDVTGLEVGDAVRVRDLPLPEGVTTELGEDEVVLRVAVPEAAEEEEEEEAAEAGSSAGPEVIGKGKEAKEEED